MAHVGKFYPLLPRRDLCLGCKNHNRSLALHWSISCTVSVSAFGAPIVNTQFAPAELITDPWSSQPEWRTDWINQSGRQFRYLISFDGWDYEQQLTFVRVRILDATDVRLMFRMRNTAPGVCSIFPGSFAPYVPLYFDSGYWGGFFQYGSCSAGARGWSQT